MINLDLMKCRARVTDSRGWNSYQCSKKLWKDGFCKTHHPESVEARRKKSSKLWDEKFKASPLGKLVEARNKIKELEAEIERLNGLLGDKGSQAIGYEQ